MKFLIAGLGSIGRRHLRNLAALGEGDIVLFRTHLSTLPEDELALYPAENSLEAALAHRPDIVIVSNPTALHLDVAIPAAESGCSLLLEKPISHSMQRVDELRRAVQKGGGIVLVGFQFRYNPGLQTAARLLADGAIGSPLSVRAHWGEYLPNWHPWEDYRQSYAARSDLGGGVVLTLSHPIDYLRWLLGEYEIAWSSVSHTGNLEAPVDDLAEIGLRFSSGVTGSLHLDYYQQPPRHDLEIIGARGTLRWDNATAAVQVYTSETKAWQIYPAPPDFERNWMFLDEIKNLIAAVKGKQPPACTLEDGCRALELALAARKAS